MDKVNQQLRRLLSKRFEEPLVEEVTCALCEQPRHLLKVNDQFVFYIHRGEELKKCHAVGWRTSFVRDYQRYIGALSEVDGNLESVPAPKKPRQPEYENTSPSAYSDDYPALWEKVFKYRAKDFMRGTEKKMDRLWLYRNLEGPVLDIGCGNCIDYEGLKDRGYHGVDYTQSFLDEAVHTYGVPAKLLTRCDARHMPFRDKEFKSGYIMDVLLHYPTEQGIEFIDEGLRVCENLYVSWGKVGDRVFTPSNDAKLTVMNDDSVRYFGEGEKFFYNSPSLIELEKLYKLTFIKGTTITRIDKI